MSNRMRGVGLVLWILVCLGAGGLGAMATNPEIDGWYQTVLKPDWNPPSWVFVPVWTTLYVLMGISAWIIWQRAEFPGAAVPLALFVIQLILNVAWSWIFFAMHQIGGAAIEIVILWFAILVTMIAFFRRSKFAGWLLVPYLGWVTFASVLTITIWRLNSGR